MATENIVKGLAYRIKAAAEGVWDKCSFWTSSDDVFYADNNSAEYKTGAINGITDALDSEDSSIAASSVAVKTLNDSLGGIRIGYDETTQKYGYWKKEADTEVFVPFSSGFSNVEIMKYSTLAGGTSTSDSLNTTITEGYFLIMARHGWLKASVSMYGDYETVYTTGGNEHVGFYKINSSATVSVSVNSGGKNTEIAYIYAFRFY